MPLGTLGALGFLSALGLGSFLGLGTLGLGSFLGLGSLGLGSFLALGSLGLAGFLATDFLPDTFGSGFHESSALSSELNSAFPSLKQVRDEVVTETSSYLMLFMLSFRQVHV